MAIPRLNNFHPIQRIGTGARRAAGAVRNHAKNAPQAVQSTALAVKNFGTSHAKTLGIGAGIVAGVTAIGLGIKAILDKKADK